MERMVVNMSVEYFPELKKIESKCKNKYGISNVSLIKDVNVLNGYSWKYNYYDEEEKKVKIISSYDLVKLRKKVESKNLDWIVTDITLARETYGLNKRLVEEHEKIKEENKLKKGKIADHTVSKCGVQYVYLNNHNKNTYWTYRDNEHPTLTRRYLLDLRDIVIALGYDWIVKDEELFNQIIKQEVDEIKN